MQNLAHQLKQVVTITALAASVLWAAAPTFTSTPITTVNAGSAYSYTLATSDADKDAIAVSVKGTLPSWLKLEMGMVSTFAGSGTLGYVNGTGIAAQFRSLKGIAITSTGTIYVSDHNDHRIRKITSAGVVTTFAGSGVRGTTNGTGTAASFDYPLGLALDAAGNLYVADHHNNSIRKVTSAGVVTTFSGATDGTGGFLNGTGTAARFNLPRDIAIDGVGNLYVTDGGNNAIRKITPAGVVTTLAGSSSAGFLNGTGTAAQFNMPEGIVVDGSGNLYVTDFSNYRIRKITSAGVVTTFAGSGAPSIVNGTGTAAGFKAMRGIARDKAGNLFVADDNTIRKITTAGVVTTISGSNASTVNGTISTATYNIPYGLEFDATGNLFEADYAGAQVRKIDFFSGLVSGTPAITDGGKYPLVLRAVAGVDTTLQSFTLTVKGAPTLTTATAQTTKEDTPLKLTLAMTNGSDKDGDALTLVVMPGANYTVSGTTITPDKNIWGTLTIPVQVTDGVNTTAAVNMTVTVTAVPDKPTADLPNTNSAILIIDEDSPVALNYNLLHAIDVDGDPLSLLLSPGAHYTLSGNVLTPEQDYVGALVVGVRVIGGSDTTAYGEMRIDVAPVNDRPEIQSVIDQTIQEDQPLVLTSAMVMATDVDGDSLQYFIEYFGDNASTFSSIAQNGVFDGIMPNANFHGSLLPRIRVFDGKIADRGKEFYMNITVVPVNDAPVVTATVAQSISEDAYVVMKAGMVTGTDVESDSLTPLFLPGANYTIRGDTLIPTQDFNGTLVAKVGLFDGVDTSASADMTITVIPVNDAPVIGLQDTLVTLVNTTLEVSVQTLLGTDTENALLSVIFAPGGNYTTNGTMITPAPDFTGVLSIPVQLFDGVLYSKAVTIKVLVSQLADIAVIPTTKQTSRFLAYPNPVLRGTETVTLMVPTAMQGSVICAIYDVMGTLIDEQSLEFKDGTAMTWDLTNRKGIKVGSGTYVAFLKITSNTGKVFVQKCMIGVQR